MKGASAGTLLSTVLYYDEKIDIQLLLKLRYKWQIESTSLNHRNN